MISTPRLTLSFLVARCKQRGNTYVGNSSCLCHQCIITTSCESMFKVSASFFSLVSILCGLHPFGSSRLLHVEHLSILSTPAQVSTYSASTLANRCLYKPHSFLWVVFFDFGHSDFRFITKRRKTSHGHEAPRLARLGSK